MKKIQCPYCHRWLPVPPHGDREDAMRPHLRDCPGLEADSGSLDEDEERERSERSR